MSFDPLGAEQIEVVRGPATLLYGSNAVGGVVNVLDDRVPDAVSDRPLHGKAEVSGATAADERAGAVSLNGGANAFAWHADFLKRKTDDLRQRRGDVRGELRQPMGGVHNVRLRLGRADYEHAELEGDEIGTVFTNESWEGRLELNHEPLGPFTGSVGVQGARRDFAAIGAEAFVPPSVTDTFAVFAFEEARSGAWRFQVGGRYEHQSAEVAEEALNRTFGAVSGSGGLVWQSPA